MEGGGNTYGLDYWFAKGESCAEPTTDACVRLQHAVTFGNKFENNLGKANLRISKRVNLCRIICKYDKNFDFGVTFYIWGFVSI